MREETVTYKVYKFDELSEEVQQKVLDEHRHWNTEYFEWWDSVYDMSYEDLKEKGFLDCKIWFSGFSCQGDGACFDCKQFDLEKLLASVEKYSSAEDYKRYKKYVAKLIDAGMIKVYIETIGHHYSHERTRKLYLESDVYERTPRLYALVKQFGEDLEEMRCDLAHDIYKTLEKEYEYLTSDEAVKESLECNEIEFLENGKVY